MANVAQLVRAPACGAGGWGFKSPHSPHFFNYLALIKIIVLYFTNQLATKKACFVAKSVQIGNRFRFGIHRDMAGSVLFVIDMRESDKHFR